jgi:hypothetical protein
MWRIPNFAPPAGFSGCIAAFSINSGALTFLGAFPPVGQISPVVVMAVDPDLVYVAASASVAGYKIASTTTGALDQIAPPISVTERTEGATVDPDAAHLFTVNCEPQKGSSICLNATISSFEIGSGGGA